MNYSNFSNFNINNNYVNKQNIKQEKDIQEYNQNSISQKDIYNTPFLFIQEHNKNFKNMGEVALKSVQQESELSRMFFSEENFNRIQKRIKQEIIKRTKGKFKLEADQDPNDLLIAMRAVYLEHAKFMPTQTIRQVKRLNDKVAENTIPDMITAIKQEYGYLKDINKPLEPIMRPQNPRVGKTLPSVFTTFM